MQALRPDGPAIPGTGGILIATRMELDVSDRESETPDPGASVFAVARTGPAIRVRNALLRLTGRAHNDAMVDVWLPEGFDHQFNRTHADRAMAALRSIDLMRSDLKALRGQLANDPRYNDRLTAEPLGQIESMVEQSLLNLNSQWGAASGQVNHGTITAAEMWAHQLPQTEDEVGADDLSALARLIGELVYEAGNLEELNDAERLRASMVIAGLRDVVSAGRSGGPMAMRAALANWELLVRSIYGAVRPVDAESGTLRKAWLAVREVLDNALRAQGGYELGKDIMNLLSNA